MGAMADATRTTTAMLDALNDPSNAEAWSSFVGRCTPIMRGVARRMGVAACEVDDVVQSTLSVFVESWRRGQYDRARGRLSAFLLTILRSRAIDLRRWHARHDPQSTPFESSLAVPESDTLERIWIDERRFQFLLASLARLRQTGLEPRTLQAFELHAIRGMPVEAVRARLGMTADEIYSAKYRVSRQLRPIAARLDELYEDL